MKGFFRLARLMSLHSDCRPKMGAVISKGGRPLGVGFNISKTRPTFFHLDSSSVHAEMSALINAGASSRLAGASIYVYRELFNGDLALARPCVACISILRRYGIKKMYYTTNKAPFWACERL